MEDTVRPNAPLSSLSIVVPVYNEAGNIDALADEISRALDTLPAWECIWVDDASTDGSRAALLGLAARDPRHRVLAHPERRGQSAALLGGWYAARHDYVGSLDGDSQNDPADLVRLLAIAVERNLDLVNGVRVRRHDGPVRRIASRIANTFRNRVTGERIADVGCSTRVLRRAFVAHLPAMRSMHRFLPTFVRLAGGRIGEAPVNHRPRLRGRSKYGIWDRLRTGLPDALGVQWLVSRSVRIEAEELSATQTESDRPAASGTAS